MTFWNIFLVFFFVCFFPENRLWHFLQIFSFGISELCNCGNRVLVNMWIGGMSTLMFCSLRYCKFPKISNTLLHTFLPKFCFFTQLFLKILSGMVNSVDPDQTAHEEVCTVCICHFVRNFCELNFRTFTVLFINRLTKTKSRPSCSKLTTLLVYDSLKFTSSDTQICWNFLLKKCE